VLVEEIVGQETGWFACAVVVNEDEECEKVLLYWSPEMCASESGIDEPLAPMMSASTHVSHTQPFCFHFLFKQPDFPELFQVRPVPLPPKRNFLELLQVTQSQSTEGWCA